MLRIILGLMGAALVTVAHSSGQSPEYTLKVDVPFVSVDVTVENASGKTVDDLAAQAFTIHENGIPQSVVYFQPVSAPYNIFLLFDRSGSTQDKWPLMQRAVAGFIATLRPQDRIAIAAFDDNFDIQLPWTGDRQSALQVLPELIRMQGSGGTNFYGSVERTIRREFRKVQGRRALVVLTDGRDTSFYKDVVNRNRVTDLQQDRPYQRTLKEARAGRIPIYFIAFNTDKNFEPNVIGGDEYQRLRVIFPKSSVPDRYLAGVRMRMEELAEASGGRVLYPERFEDVIPLYGKIGRELGTSYTLGYVSSNNRDGGAFRQIEVRTLDTTLRITQSRNGYYARK